MPFRPYHTGQRQQIDFTPANGNAVTIYNCGPTVYSTAHIGNFRSFLFADLLRRYLDWRGFEVTQIMNITDVGHLTDDDVADSSGEDKLQKKAAELGWDAFRVAAHFEEEFHRDRKLLGCKDAHRFPRATEHIPEMLAQIQVLLDKGHAYIVEETGEVYYDLSTFPDYGWLSNKAIEDLIAGARVEVDTKKKNPADFALWKVDAAHLMQWNPHADELWQDYPSERPSIDQRIQKGFPGWHIECSAMSMKYLGETLDFHTGGEDNIFPHHECEIAQATGATGKPFVRMWMHARHLLVDNKKMSKSEGTLYTLDDLVAKGYTPTELRYLMLANHYRAPMNFTFDGLDAARASIQRLQNTRDLLANAAEGSASDASDAVGGLVLKMQQGFREAMDDDLNASNALAAVFGFVTEVNKAGLKGADAQAALEALDNIDEVLNVLSKESRHGVISKDELDAAVGEASDAEALAAKLAESADGETVRAALLARSSRRTEE